MSTNGQEKSAHLRQLLHELGQELEQLDLPAMESARGAEVLSQFQALLGSSLPSFLLAAAIPATLSPLRYRELFDFTPDGRLVTDRSGIILEANQAAAVLLGTRKEFLPGKPLGLYLAKGRRPAFYSLLLRLRREENTIQDWATELAPLRGERREVVLWASALADSDGRPADLLWLVRDVTSLTRAEHALRAERDFADSLLAAAPAIVLVLDQEGRILRGNAYLSQVTDYEEVEVMGRDWHWLLLEEDRATFEQLIRRTLIYGRHPSYPGQLRTRAGPPRQVVWTARSLLRREANAPVVLLLGQDVTELHEAQEQALQAERLAAIGQVMTVLAHESRNLLQRGQACLERLGWRLKDQPEALDLLERAQRTQAQLAQLYEDVRTFAAPLRLERKSCDLGEVWRQAWAEVCAVFRDRQAELVEDVAGVDLVCWADAFRLDQVFRNVLENAFQAVPPPRQVRVTVSCREVTREGLPALQLLFRDNGLGLGEEQRERLFEAFYTTRAQGSGLGMTIARRIVSAHGGQIAVGAAGPPGAEILLTLPRSGP
jgi:PAS domain S-box-containing protein